MNKKLKFKMFYRKDFFNLDLQRLFKKLFAVSKMILDLNYKFLTGPRRLAFELSSSVSDINGKALVLA